MYRAYDNIKVISDNKVKINDGGLVQFKGYMEFYHTVSEYLKNLSTDFPTIYHFNFNTFKLNVAKYFRGEKTKLTMVGKGYDRENGKVLDIDFVFNIIKDRDESLPFVVLNEDGSNKKAVLGSIYDFLFPNEIIIGIFSNKYNSALSIDTFLDVEYLVNTEDKYEKTFSSIIEGFNKYKDYLTLDNYYISFTDSMDFAKSLDNHLRVPSQKPTITFETMVENFMVNYPTLLAKNNSEKQKYIKFVNHKGKHLFMNFGFNDCVKNGIEYYAKKYETNKGTLKICVFPTFTVFQLNKENPVVLNYYSGNLNSYVNNISKLIPFKNMTEKRYFIDTLISLLDLRTKVDVVELIK